MQFNSIDYFFFLPVVVVIYFSIPFRIRWAWLLVSSYFFYMNWSIQYALLMLTSTVITYSSGILIHKYPLRKKLWVTLSLFLNLTILAIFKYSNFAITMLNHAQHIMGKHHDFALLNIVLPVGISFYTFQALSYTLDIYKGKIKPEYHFGYYALFVSFFPQLVAGPIEHSYNLLPQLRKQQHVSYKDLKYGLLLIFAGLFKKIVIADRLDNIVNFIYAHPSDMNGIQLLIGTLFFGFQIYTDFSAYNDIAVGSASLMGYKLTSNFLRPYFSKSINEFWRRWHITLGDWFRHYLYYPLGGNRKGKIVYYRNIMIIFIISGLWHGAQLSFIVWGFIHGFYIVIGDLLQPIRKRVVNFFKIDVTCFAHKLYQVIFTFSLVTFAWVFFRAGSLSNSLSIIKKILKTLISPYNFSHQLLNPMTYKKLLPIVDNDSNYVTKFILYEVNFAFILISFLMIIEFIQRKIHLRDELMKNTLWFRWVVYLLLIYSIIIFGFYGGYTKPLFIYFQF